MLTNVASISFVYRNFACALVHFVALSIIVLSLTACSDNGQGGPTISSLSTPTDTPSSEGEGVSSDSTSAETGSTGGEDPTNSMLATTDSPAGTPEDLDPAAGIAGPPEGEEDPTISVTSTATGATARLTWDVYPDPNVVGYHVYYGKQSPGEYGSCSYEGSQSFEAPPATIAGLDPNTPYFFAISAYRGDVGELESPCSNEVLVVTPSAQG